MIPSSRGIQIATLEIATLALALVAAGCATRSFVRQETERLETRLADLPPPSEIEMLEEGRRKEERRLEETGREIEAAHALAALAQERATEAVERARGSLLAERIHELEGILFRPGSAELSHEARTLLDQLAERLRLEDKGCYLEVQGHTDATGHERDNLRLGGQRANAVRRHLHLQGGIPLHHLAVVSLGSLAPLADNATPEGRARNRRVVVVVLRGPRP